MTNVPVPLTFNITPPAWMEPDWVMPPAVVRLSAPIVAMAPTFSAPLASSQAFEPALAEKAPDALMSISPVPLAPMVVPAANERVVAVMLAPSSLLTSTRAVPARITVAAPVTVVSDIMPPEVMLRAPTVSTVPSEDMVRSPPAPSVTALAVIVPPSLSSPVAVSVSAPVVAE